MSVSSLGDVIFISVMNINIATCFYKIMANSHIFQISRSTMSMSRQLLGRVSGLVSRRRVSASPTLADKVTHTGQMWDKDDPRNARFTGDVM